MAEKKDLTEKKIEMEINGKMHRIAPHMVKDFLKFGASVVPRVAKEPPKELLTIPLPKKLILPRTEIPLEVKPLEVKPPETRPVEVLKDLPPDPVTAVDEVTVLPEVTVERKKGKPGRKSKK